MKYPFIKQKDLKDCGVSCLLMLVRYYGGGVSTEYLRELTNTNITGTTAFDLIIKKKYAHFIIIYKIDKKKKKLLVADPNNNHITKMTFEEFNNISTNQFLLLKPKKKIMYVEENKELKSFIFSKIHSNAKTISYIITLSLSLTFLQILLSFDFKFILDKSVSYFSINNLINLSIVFLIIILLKQIMEYIRAKLINIFNHDLDISMFYKVYNHILSLPYLYYKNRTTGEIVSRISDLSSIRNVISKCIITCIIDLILITIISHTAWSQPTLTKTIQKN